eukprot:CAMPEP_0197519986 /NCGR_PEP_ID=MMETSP1318-20131121/5284_1 /TAXON_ID=552666 /ORGANISM="Partenskyella glossopodia, Strain RCC365" /LENGTH=388 /DNA_ID=CAMNT_0043071295 /DNA_START=127 /DNA_END=1293 /DNA_ORIENTATION=+
MERSWSLEKNLFFVTYGGAISVTIFFILSGLNMGLFYPAEKLQNWNSIKIFWWKRIAKIQPLCWFVFILSIPAGIDFFGRSMTPARQAFAWIRPFFALETIIYLPGPSLQPQLWQMQNFLLYYALHPFVIQYVMNMRRLGLWITGTLLFVFSIGILAFNYYVLTIQAYNFPPWRFPQYFMGSLVALRLVASKNPLNRYVSLVLTDLGTAAIIAAASTCWNQKLERFYSFVLAPVVMLWIFAMISEEEQAARDAEKNSYKFALRSLSSIVFNWDVMQYLGKCSFSIYVFQFLAKNMYFALLYSNPKYLFAFWKEMQMHDNHHLLLAVCFTTIVGILAHNLIEEPLKKCIDPLTKLLVKRWSVENLENDDCVPTKPRKPAIKSKSSNAKS